MGFRLVADRDNRCPQFDVTMAGPHRVSVRVELLIDGTVQEAVQGYGKDLPVSEGTVTQARSQFARQSLSLTLTDEALAPLGVSRLGIDGAELRVWSGARMPDGDDELLCMGTFLVQDVSWGFPFGGLPVTGLSRGKRISDARFRFPATYGEASAFNRLRELLGRPASPWSEVIFGPGLVDSIIPQATYDRDRDAAAADVVKALGAEVGETPLGDFLVSAVPDVNTADVDIVIAAGEAGSLVSQQRSVSRDGVFNAIIATSAAGAQTFSGEAYDLDTLSETQWTEDGSGFGQKPGFYSSQNLTSDLQCQVAAAAILRDYRGSARSVSFVGVANPAWQVSDVARFVYADGTFEQHLLDSLTIPIIGGTTSGTTRVARPVGVS